MAKVATVECLQPTRRLDCPCCSARVLDDDGRTASSQCPHFLYSWNGTMGDFDECKDLVDSVLENLPGRFTEPTDNNLLAALPASALVFQIETREHACGPVVCTDVVAFDPLAA